jgi:uncharacterized protein
MGAQLRLGHAADDLAEKELHLLRLLADMGPLMVAFSGGTDSAYLAWAAKKVLGDRVLLVTACSPSLPESHKREAAAFARDQGFRHEFMPTNEFENPLYLANDPERCYYCKDEILSRMEDLARQRGIANIVHGVNVDDAGDYRPGLKASARHSVRAPLAECGMTKADIRELSRRAGLATWDRPASACLSTRIPYGTPITVESVKTVEKGEDAMLSLGFRQFRVRLHGDLVRIEISPDELPRALTREMAGELTAIFKPMGFLYVTLDLEGYRTGSFNARLGKS